ncbi:MAG: hypothetical protein QNJ54_23885 [Prochloraceae cyanobacterium]|nr:hypothetical protein [Prochloraceae cyanobacterium]
MVSAAEKKVVDVGAAINTEKNIQLEREFKEGEISINTAWLLLAYRPTPEVLTTDLASLASMFRHPAKVVREVGYTDLLWLESFPLVWRIMLNSPYARRIKYFSKAVVGIMPLVLERSKASCGVELISNSGLSPIYADVVSSPKHSVVLAATGEGKSVFMGEFVTTGLANGQNVTIIDSTREDGSGTYEALTNFLGGEYFNCISSSSNIFETAYLWKKEIDPKLKQAKQNISQNLLTEGLVLMCTDSDTPKHEVKTSRGLINLTLSAFFDDPQIIERYESAVRGGIGSINWTSIPTIHDYLPFLSPDTFNIELTSEKISALYNIRLAIEAVLSGPLGTAIGSPSTIRPDNPLVVYALGGVDNEADLAVLALAAYSAALSRSFESASSFLLFDEVSYLLGNYECFAKIIGSIWAKARKLGISAMCAGQDLNSILKTNAASQVIENTTNFFIGGIKSPAVAKLSEILDIPEKILLLNTMDNFRCDQKEFATSWLYKNDSYLTYAKYYPALEQLAILVNEPNLAARRAEYFQKYPNKYEAIAEFTKYFTSTVGA